MTEKSSFDKAVEEANRAWSTDFELENSKKHSNKKQKIKLGECK